MTRRSFIAALAAAVPGLKLLRRLSGYRSGSVAEFAQTMKQIEARDDWLKTWPPVFSRTWLEKHWIMQHGLPGGISPPKGKP